LGRSSPTLRQFGQTEDGREVLVGLEHRLTGHAADLAVAPMHVDHPLRPGLFVQRVDVLGDDGYLALILAFQPDQRPMGVVRGDAGRAEQGARPVVEVEHLLLVAVPGVQRRDLLEVDTAPQPVRVAERVDSAFLGDAGAGQHRDAGREEILMHAANLAPC
jgi:hypothetical protein